MSLDNRVLSYQTAFSTTLTVSPDARTIVVPTGDVTGGGNLAFPVFGERVSGNQGVIFPVLSLAVGGGEITLANPGGGATLSFSGSNSIRLYDRLDNLHDFTEAAIEFTDASGFAAGDISVGVDEIVLDLTGVTLESSESILLSVGFAENEAPVFTSDAAVSLAENTRAVVDLGASDADDDAVTFSITGGADAGLFELTAGNRLAFVAAPDFDDPRSDDGSNTYRVEVTADDGWEGRTAQTVLVTVTDVDEPPVATDDAGDSLRTAEDSATTDLVAALLANDRDPDRGSLRIVAVDTGATRGAVRFDLAAQTLVYDPDGAFDDLREGQSATDRFTYTISDGTFTATATAEVTIDGLDAAPVVILGTRGNDTLVDPAQVANTIWGDALDTLTGRGGNDRIFARGGDDQVSGDAATIGPAGHGGNDRIQGGEGNDSLYGDATATLFGKGGNDVLLQGTGTGLLVGDALALEGGARGGNDRLTGVGAPEGNTERVALFAVRPPETGLYGDAATTMAGASIGGNDTLDASAGGVASWLFGDARELVDQARGGNDTLRGGGLGDILAGDAATLGGTAKGGHDLLSGGGGDDTLFGDGETLLGFARGGHDELRGGAGDDVLWGDGSLFDAAVGGRDRFWFQGDFGDDAVRDFRRGEDRLVFSGYRPGELQITVVGSDTVITTLGDDSVTLVDFTGTLRNGADILFA